MISGEEKEKLNIYVPEKTEASLRRDAELFEIFRPGRTDINLNRFLNKLIEGYYNSYKQERNSRVNSLKEILACRLPDTEKPEETAEEIMEQVILPRVPRKKGKNLNRLPFKETKDTQQMIREIRKELGIYVSFSQYMCRMFMSYCEKPIYEREKIIFADKVAFLEEACREKREITFATTNKPSEIHHVIPWEIVEGKDEMFNYLLCQKYNDYKERNEAKTFRICRINRPSFYHTSGSLDEGVVRRLKKMKEYGPQFAINEETETCVAFTPTGQTAYMKIHTNRPIADRKDEPEEDGSRKYYFNCSEDQIYRYLLRFNVGEIKIIYPDRLRKRVIKTYEDALEFLKKP